MKILFLTFFFEPDLSAGSFRNTSLFKQLLNELHENDFVHVITSQPNRYKSFTPGVKEIELGNNYQINRIKISLHGSGIIEQFRSFFTFYFEVLRIVRNQNYDIVYVSSSRLFSAFLGSRIARKKKIPLYIDIRDIMVDAIQSMFRDRKFLQIPALKIMKTIESYTFSNAKHINLVSNGFKEYFKQYPNPEYSFFTNGIDDVFLNNPSNSDTSLQNPKIITYAGNIGLAQGLERIIPFAARELGDEYFFRIIGDGGTKDLLLEKVKELNIKNVEIINPVSRDLLIKYYASSSFLFLHLNDFEICNLVLPSKLFEYGAFNKPIIAGVSGYARQFIRENMTNCILFNPTDVSDMVSQLHKYKFEYTVRDNFINKFARKNIMREMAKNIINTYTNQIKQ